MALTSTPSLHAVDQLGGARDGDVGEDQHDRLVELPRRVHLSVKVTGLAQKLGQLEAVHRDFQSKYWADLKILGQPCNFYA